MNATELKAIINKIYNLIATETDYDTRTDIDKKIIDIINNLYIKER